MTLRQICSTPPAPYKAASRHCSLLLSEPLLNFHCLRFQEHTCMHPFPTIYMFRNLKYQVIATIPFLDYGRQNQVNSLQYARSVMICLKPFSLSSVALWCNARPILTSSFLLMSLIGLNNIRLRWMFFLGYPLRISDISSSLILIR